MSPLPTLCITEKSRMFRKLWENASTDIIVDGFGESQDFLPCLVKHYRLFLKILVKNRDSKELIKVIKTILLSCLRIGSSCHCSGSR